VLPTRCRANTGTSSSGTRAPTTDPVRPTGYDFGEESPFGEEGLTSTKLGGVFPRQGGRHQLRLRADSSLRSLRGLTVRGMDLGRLGANVGAGSSSAE